MRYAPLLNSTRMAGIRWRVSRKRLIRVYRFGCRSHPVHAIAQPHPPCPTIACCRSVSSRRPQENHRRVRWRAHQFRWRRDAAGPAERRLGIAERLAAAIADPRDPALVDAQRRRHPARRILAIACGYEDADDLDDLRSDPGFKLACGRLPDSGRDLARSEDFVQLQAQIEEVDAKLTAYHRADECSRRLVKIPSVGPIGAMLLRMKTPAPTQFKSGRQFAAWIGLTPKDHSTAGKLKLGVITRAGDETLRAMLVVGATAAIQQAQRSGKASPWLAALLKRKSPKLAAVALANKTARVAWKMMPTGEE